MKKIGLLIICLVIFTSCSKNSNVNSFNGKWKVVSMELTESGSNVSENKNASDSSMLGIPVFHVVKQMVSEANSAGNRQLQQETVFEFTNNKINVFQNHKLIEENDCKFQKIDNNTFSIVTNSVEGKLMMYNHQMKIFFPNVKYTLVKLE